MANLLRVPNTAVTDIRVINTSDILTITYPSTSIVRIVYKVTNNPSMQLIANTTGALGAVTLRCTFNSADATYATHDAFVAAIGLSNSSNSNPSPIFVCPDLPGVTPRTVAIVYEAPVTQTA
jgi:hypothetical protein